MTRMKPAAGSRKPNKASEATVDRIVRSARRILVENGYAEFSTRRVAKAAGISVGNLAYHFPSKQDLLRAVVGQLVDEYSTQFTAILTRSDIPAATEDLGTLIEWLLTETLSQDTVHIFRELWAISLHDEATRIAMDALYDHLMEGVVQLLVRYYPYVEIQAIRELAQVLALISEGTIVLYGTKRDRAVTHERIVELAVSLIKTMKLDLRLPKEAGE